MSKNVTVWRDQHGSGEYSNANEGLVLLLETGGRLLLETGGALVLEDSVYTPKALSAWTSETKYATSWNPDSGTGEFSTTEGTTRTTEAGTTRTTEAGVTRTTEAVILTIKARTAWTESDT